MIALLMCPLHAQTQLVYAMMAPQQRKSHLDGSLLGLLIIMNIPTRISSRGGRTKNCIESTESILGYYTVQT